MSVSENFKTFCDDLKISSGKRSTISTRFNSIVKRLNTDFWNMDSSTGGRYLGSYGRHTANGWVSDIDMLFEMPWSVYNKYDAYITNGQSAFLQEVKNSIAKTYPSTYLKGDGQIVQVIFSDSMKFEVLPAFKYTDGSYAFADSNSGGSWKKTNPVPEINSINYGDSITNNNLKRLCRMTRAWKYYCNVPIKGLLIDTLAYRFLTNWNNRDKSYLYYDWMCRDFFEYLKNQNSTQTIWYAVGSGQQIYNPDNFRYKATIAYNKSVDAIQLQTDGKLWSTKQKWREIYGNRYPS
ncbi:SMODS domain-containing nucleotidyltransferase [Flagellimonas sp. W118]|uniref:SMODS domain-containing nucleotidyltransferase n=1 Tax=Flagellimonas sp. W118 TaxID=3410791 RepID=UPI003BF4D6D9